MARILVIDDEEQIRNLLSMTLAMDGHEVIVASQAKEALRLHEKQPADLVITDILMPDQDGIEVIMALRRCSPRPKIIAISGGGRLQLTEVLEMAEPLGAFALLRKPFLPDTVLDTVRRALAA